MSIDRSPTAERSRPRRRSMQNVWAGLLLAAATMGACGSDGGSDEAVGTPATANGAVAAPELAAQPATVADLFPPGDGRELLLNSCATCHAVACAAMGQRTDGRWRELEAAHREHVPALSDEDRTRIFAYLRTHFNESRPEPHIPPEFLDRGCTPF